MKVCNKCLEHKNECDFYKTKSNPSGLFNSCKNCIILYSRNRYKTISKNQSWVKAKNEKIRNSQYYLNKRSEYREGRSVKVKEEYTKRYKEVKKSLEKYPERKNAYSAVIKIAKRKGYHLHHWNYNEIFLMDVIEMPYLEHKKLHRHTFYDKELKIFIAKDSLYRLDTREKTEFYINNILTNLI